MQNGDLRLSGARWRNLLVAVAASVATLWSTAAMATITQGDFSVFGFFETREAGHWGEAGSRNNGTPTTFATVLPGLTLATPGRAASQSGGSFEFNRWDLAEARQLADIRPDYHMVKNYKFLGRFDTLLLKDADFFAFYRPWYDALGTIKNKGRAEPNRDWTRFGQFNGQNPGDNAIQNEFFRDDLREFYAQLNFSDNFSMRIGKQEIIWSEADALSGTEVTNPVDTRFHGVYGAESPEDTRVNVRMVKLNYILPDYFNTANNELEAFWIPGDVPKGADVGIILNGDARNPYVTPAAISGFGPQFYNQDGQPYRFQGVMDFGARPMLFLPIAGKAGAFADFRGAPASRRPSNSISNSEFGMRFSSLLPIGNGLQASFIYLYEFRDARSENCALNCSAQQLGGPGFGPTLRPGIFFKPGFFAYGPPRPGVPKAGTLELARTVDYRRNHFFGLTGTYYDKDLTDIVYRYDILYQPKHHQDVAGDPRAQEWTEFTRWIIAADRPTYIPWLSKQHTFLVAQYTATWLPDRPSGASGFLATGKTREISNLAFVSAINWLMNGQLTATNTVAWDIDNNTGELSTTNSYRYSRNVLLGLNAQWFMGRSGRYTDPYLFSRYQRFNELEFTLTYEI